MSSLLELEQQLAELQARYNAERDRVRTEALAGLKQMLASGTLTADDLRALIPKPATPPRTDRRRGKVAPKFRNPNTGETWGGQGAPPIWIRDLTAEERDRLLIPAAA